MKYFLGYLLFSVAISSFADTGWSQKALITEVYTINDTVMVRMAGDNIDYSSGACTDQSYYAFKVDSEGKKLMYSQILAAHLAKIPTLFWISGNSCIGQFGNKQGIGSVRTFSA